jgi:hypothetical protein
MLHRSAIQMDIAMHSVVDTTVSILRLNASPHVVSRKMADDVPCKRPVRLDDDYRAVCMSGQVREVRLYFRQWVVRRVTSGFLGDLRQPESYRDSLEVQFAKVYIFSHLPVDHNGLDYCQHRTQSSSSSN